MEPIISVKGLKQYFPLRDKSGGGKLWLRAVDGVDLEIGENQVFGLVGESGSGKTTVGRAIIRLYKPTAGRIFFRGRDISAAPEGEMRRLRNNIQMIYQDPHASLNPRMRVGTIIRRALDIHTGLPRAAKRQRVQELLDEMGLLPEHYNRFPHELSGGQQQRVGIARALAVEPEFVVMDEPTSSLDVSVQAQILNLLKDIQRRLNLSCLFISHDMRAVNHICDRVAVIYCGKIVEAADRDSLFRIPRHPYTRLLIASIPEIGRRTTFSGPEPSREIPSPVAPPPGCRFHPRCPDRLERCSKEEPPQTTVAGNHLCACWRQS